MSYKRRSAGNVPIVEKLYKKGQESYDNAGGFDAEDDEVEERRARISEMAQKKRDREAELGEKPELCLECNGQLYEARLWETFSHPVCDKCSKDNPKFNVISRTKAKKDYVLKDEDLDLRKPVLRYISKKNPHNPRYGDMKLYLEIQVKERSLHLHGSMSILEETKEMRYEKREEMAAKKYENRIKKMQKELRPTVALKEEGFHQHEFGAEEKIAGDKFVRTCRTCGYKNQYEKL